MSKSLNDMAWTRFSNGVLENNEHNMTQLKDLLDSTGCGFCLAKFKQVTLHLGTGMVHSCHHPTPHKIDPEEVQKNPNLLFNTSILKTARAEMLTGKKPSECDYCWRIENDGGTSDRHYKSSEPWALNDHDEITKLNGNEDIYPSYLEVSFSNVCNMKCAYCGPEFSSKWVEELKQHGPLKVLPGTKDEQWIQGYQNLDTLNYKNRDFNPYIDAYWKWFPDALPHLKHLRITGGEPLMSKETFKTMDWLIENPNRELEFSINSNFSVPDKLWDQFIEKLEKLKHDCVSKITIYTSIEGWGDRAEYARTGLDFELLRSRYEQVLALGNVRCVIMAAYNIFSITSFKEMLEWMHEMKIKYNPNNPSASWEKDTGYQLAENGGFAKRKTDNPDHHVTVGIDIPYLRHPKCLDAHYCTDDLLEDFMIPSLDYMAKHIENSVWSTHQGFEHYEVDKFKRIVVHRLYFNKKNSPESQDVIKNRAKFYDMVNELDKRRGTDFLKTFPEMNDFYYACRDAKEMIDD